MSMWTTIPHRAGAKSYWVTRSAPSSHAILDGVWAIAGVESDEMVCGSAEILSLPRAQRRQLGDLDLAPVVAE
jgi:hypothetical protein